MSRLNLPETRPAGDRDVNAPLVVGTYEGIDHALRTGRSLKDIGTVVIDEVQMLEDPERGHRLDGLIARLKHVAPEAQFLYLSATIGVPGLLAEKLGANLVRYADRPVALERHLLFVERSKKIGFIKQMVAEEYKVRSSKGYRGQTIVFTNSRARCHVIADALGKNAAPYHAGLSAQERRDVERRFASGEIAAVVTTAALAAGVDFPASQVIFDALAMGIKWLTVQEFHQMMGRAGRPDFHDLGRVVIMAEPGGSYSRTSGKTEEEVAVGLLRGEMEEVAPEYDMEQSSEEFVANAVVCGGDEQQVIRMTRSMVGTLEPALPTLLDYSPAGVLGADRRDHEPLHEPAAHLCRGHRGARVRRGEDTVTAPESLFSNPWNYLKLRDAVCRRYRSRASERLPAASLREGREKKVAYPGPGASPLAPSRALLRIIMAKIAVPRRLIAPPM